MIKKNTIFLLLIAISNCNTAFADTQTFGTIVSTAINSSIETLNNQTPTAFDGYNGGLRVWRDASKVSGGTSGTVNTTSISYTKTGVSEATFEWSNLAILDNYARGVSQNVAMYGQGNKYSGASNTWASTFEAHDRSGNANPTSGLVGAEIDVFANGSDNNKRRIGIDLVTGFGVGITNPPQIAYGMRIGPQYGNSANGTFNTGIGLIGTFNTAGIDFSTATLPVKVPAIRLAGNQFLSFTASNDRTMQYTSSGLQYKIGSTVKMQVSDKGIIYSSGGAQLPSTTVALLPTCSIETKGLLYMVNDAKDPTYNGILTGGSTTTTLAACNGTVWTAH